MNRIVRLSALRALSIAALVYCGSAFIAHESKPAFKVIAFYTAKQDPAHISFVHEAERAAFQTYMEHGGAWMGFHFAAFALTPSAELMADDIGALSDLRIAR
jgi:uncharacterized protein